MLRRNSHAVRGVSLNRTEESLWWERCVEEVGFESGVMRELWMVRVES